jgi:hypothetical protein
MFGGRTAACLVEPRRAESLAYRRRQAGAGPEPIPRIGAILVLPAGVGGAAGRMMANVLDLATPHWFVIRTRGRHEKKVDQELARRQIETFLPLLPRWS